MFSRPDALYPQVQSQQHAPGILDVLLDLDQELDGLLAIEQTVVVRQGEVHHGSALNLAVHNHGAVLDGMQAQDGGLGQVDDGRAHQGAEDTAVADGKGTASHVFQRKLAVACLKWTQVSDF